MMTIEARFPCNEQALAKPLCWRLPTLPRLRKGSGYCLPPLVSRSTSQFRLDFSGSVFGVQGSPGFVDNVGGTTYKFKMGYGQETTRQLYNPAVAPIKAPSKVSSLVVVGLGCGDSDIHGPPRILALMDGLQYNSRTRETSHIASHLHTNLGKISHHDSNHESTRHQPR